MTMQTLAELIKAGALKPVLPTKTVHVPEWGRDIELRGMSADSADDYNEAIRDKTGSFNNRAFREKYLIRSIYEGDVPALSEKNPAHMIWLKSQPATLIQRLFMEAQRLNGSDADEDVEGNLPTTPSGDSNTD